MESEVYRDVSMEMLDPVQPIKGAVSKIVDHFAKPIEKEQALRVDEGMCLQYLEIAQDIKDLEKTKEHMKPLLLKQRCGSEKTAVIGKAMLCFNSVEAQTGIDWKQAYLDVCGEMPPEDVAKYTKVTRAGYTSVEVKKL